MLFERCFSKPLPMFSAENFERTSIQSLGTPLEVFSCLISIKTKTKKKSEYIVRMHCLGPQCLDPSVLFF